MLFGRRLPACATMLGCPVIDNLLHLVSFLPSCSCVAQAPEGSPPDVRCRLPTAVINSALELVTHRPEGPDDTLLDMYRSLTSAATASLGTMQVEQQHEVAGLTQRTAALEAAQAQQQQQTGALQQQVQDMQAALQQLLQQQQGGRQ